MKINLIVNSFPTASETFIFNLVTGLEKKGTKINVLALNKSSDIHLYKDRIDEWSNRIYYYNKFNIGFMFRFLFFRSMRKHNLLLLKNNVRAKERILALSLWDFIHTDNPDIIHFAFSGIAAELNNVINIGLKSYSFVSCRGSAEKIKPLVDLNRANKLTSILGKIDRVHCVSEDMLNTIQNFENIKSKSFINFPSIDTSRFNFTKREHLKKDTKVRILSTGRLHYQKGYVFALNAIKLLVSRGYSIEYTICGSGPDEGLIRYMIQELSIEDNVILKGKVSSNVVRDLLVETDLFLLSSIYEGIANAALEAISSGVPIITTNAGGMAEVIKNKKNGIIVNRFSSSELANGIQFLIDNYDLAINYSLDAYELVKSKFNLEKQIVTFIKEYEKINNSSL